jgi:predicted ATPase
VDKLSFDQQLTLKVAAVIGFEFDAEILLQLLTETNSPYITEEDLDKNLETFCQLGLVRRNLSNRRSYSFAQNLAQEVIYEQMLFSQRRELHSKVAALIEKKYPGAWSFYPILAFHFKKMENIESALQYLNKAGTAAAYYFANKEAVNFFTDAIELVDRPERRGSLEHISLERKLSYTLFNLGNKDACEDHLRTALQILKVKVPRYADTISKSFKCKSLPSMDAHHSREATLLLTLLAKVSVLSIILHVVLTIALISGVLL